MPGLTLMIANDGRINPDCDPCKTQTLLLHGPEYRANTAVSGSGLHLGWVGYDGYPVRIFSSGGSLIYFEGRIYNRSFDSVEKDLLEIAAATLGPEGEDSSVERFILTNEGSYVVAIVRQETCEALVFSDAFCRLPLYYSADDSAFTISREAKFVHALRPAPAFDRVGCAQILAFGLPLGDRTVLEGVRSFPDAGVLRAQMSGGRLRWRLRTLYTWNLDDEDDSKPVARQASEFADLFVTACRNWGSHSDSQGNLVSLSGGHDSRAVVAGLARAGSNVVAVSYRDPNGKREFEIRYAQLLTSALGVEWHCLDLPSPSESSYEELVWLKDGMNLSYMGYILSYLEKIVSRWGRHWTYLSGDGGDDCLKVTAPKRTFRQLDDVVRYILETETCIRPENAEAMLRLPAGTLRAELRQLFASYPEQNLSRRIKHFKIFERGRRCYFEGEDRARAFLWQDSPFYSLPLYRHCMRIPDHQKRYNVFCREALIALSPRAAAVPVTSSGYPPVSWKYIFYERAKMAFDLPEPLPRLARLLRRHASETSYAVAGRHASYLQDQLTRPTPLSELLDGQQLPLALQQIDAYSFSCLWTVAMLEKAYRSRIG